MRAIIQRVNFASVEVDKKKVSNINRGILLFVGFGKEDTDEDLKYIFKKGNKKTEINKNTIYPLYRILLSGKEGILI
mgnify:CR=1 FL=1